MSCIHRPLNLPALLLLIFCSPNNILLGPPSFLSTSDACEFHHDGSLLTEFDPESEDFHAKVSKAEKDCEEEELAVSGNCEVDLESGSVIGDKCSSDKEFEPSREV